MLPQSFGDLEDVFIAAAAHVHDDETIAAELFGEVERAREGVAWLERGEYAFELGAELEIIQRFGICGADIFGAANVM